MENLSIPLQRFNDRVRTMNQTRAKDMVLTAEEARMIHGEMFALLAQVAALNKALLDKPNTEIEVRLDGQSWS